MSSGDMAVRGSACQDDCGVRGHVGIWIVEGEQLRAAAYSAAQGCVCGRRDGAYSLILFFFHSLPTTHKTVIILVYSV